MIKRMLSLSLSGRRNGNMDGGTTSSTVATSNRTRDEEEEVSEWEMRPGGMLVQKRRHSNLDSSSTSNKVPAIRVRVVYGSTRYEISVSSQSTFGELKKLLTVECGLQHSEQRLIFRGKERGDRNFLDLSGVKDRSKIILIEDPCSREKRLFEMRRNGKIQRAHCAISDVSAEVDRLEKQVSVIENSINNGVKVPEVQITTMIELLMVQAVKLDSIPDDGDKVLTLKICQGKRVQKCVEALDVLKLSNASLKPIVVTTEWETFDPPPATTPWNLLD